MKKALIIGIWALFLLLVSFKRKDIIPFNVPKGWPQPVYNFKKKPLTAEKINLGRTLFYDPALSKDSTISCNSCHSQFSSFTHADHALSHGIAGKIGNRNSPVLINLAWSSHFMWDGSITHLNEQAKLPITNPLEMDENMDSVVSRLQQDIRYRSLFSMAFEDSVATEEKMLEALTQFMLTLVSTNSKYDRVMAAQDTFTANELRGYTLFKAHCSSCHTEPLFTNDGFENNGLYVDETLNDFGRIKITHTPADSLKFKVPTLRNIEYSKPYMHDGRFKTLSQVINSYMRGIQHSPTLSPKLQKMIYLDEQQKNDLIAFLLTLSDKDFIHNKRFAYCSK